MGEGLRYPHLPTRRPPPHRVNLGQTLRDGQPAIITTQTHKRERPRAGKCWEGGEEGSIERKRTECFSSFTSILPVAEHQDWLVSGPSSL